MTSGGLKDHKSRGLKQTRDVSNGSSSAQVNALKRKEEPQGKGGGGPPRLYAAREN